MSGSGERNPRAGVVTVCYTDKTVMRFSCDRCLEDVDLQTDYRFEHVLVRELADEADADFILVQDSVLDVDELAASDIILELPSKVVCMPECKGLCPVCGTNLNKDSCDCRSRQTDSRLAALTALLEQ